MTQISSDAFSVRHGEKIELFADEPETYEMAVRLIERTV